MLGYFKTAITTFPANLSGTYPWPQYGVPCVRPFAKLTFIVSFINKKPIRPIAVALLADRLVVLS